MDIVTLAMAKAYSDSKGGYVEPGAVMLETTLDSGAGEFSASFKEEFFIDKPFEEGKNYYVAMDSGTVTAVAKEIDLDGDKLIGMGNLQLFNGENTGERFFAICSKENIEGEGFVASVADFNNGSRMKITAPETIHPIDPKYLPDTVATKADIFGAMEASY